MRGICGRPRTDVFTADEFYPTGDLGRLDADGYLYLTGRRDDMFKVRGATVYPSEVERALHGIRGVQRAFVVDIVQDGSSAVAAAVIATPDRALTVDELEAEARARLSAFKVPTRWRLVAAEDVPMTTTGKVDKAALQQLLG
jgi:acyl-CoA synthetase (AMP-forming)/AMP-acid ligase II